VNFTSAIGFATAQFPLLNHQLRNPYLYN